MQAVLLENNEDHFGEGCEASCCGRQGASRVLKQSLSSVLFSSQMSFLLLNNWFILDASVNPLQSAPFLLSPAAGCYQFVTSRLTHFLTLFIYYFNQQLASRCLDWILKPPTTCVEEWLDHELRELSVLCEKCVIRLTLCGTGANYRLQADAHLLSFPTGVRPWAGLTAAAQSARLLRADGWLSVPLFWRAGGWHVELGGMQLRAADTRIHRARMGMFGSVCFCAVSWRVSKCRSVSQGWCCRCI